MTREAGKGSKPRPHSVDVDTFKDNWERTFRNKVVDEKLSDDEQDNHQLDTTE